MLPYNTINSCVKERTKRVRKLAIQMLQIEDLEDL